MPRSSTSPARDLAELFGPNGALARNLPDFESRPGQLQMAEVVADALQREATALIEAPTGTGKSLAYLVPALMQGRTVIVATANKALQHQLFAKDIPLASRMLGRKIDAVVVKGRSNYICNWKWDRELQAQSFLAGLDPDGGQADAVRAWLRATATGDVDDLPMLLAPDLRQRVVSFADDCLHQDCEHDADNCWVNHMRQRAAGADVLITNHHLLLSALQLDEMGERILPPATIYVIDEAHHLVDTATAVFEVEVTDNTLPALLARKVYRDHVEENDLDELRFENRLAFDDLARLGSADGRPSGAFRIEGDLERVRALAKRLTGIAQALQDRNPYQSRSTGVSTAVPLWLAGGLADGKAGVGRSVAGEAVVDTAAAGGSAAGEPAAGDVAVAGLAVDDVSTGEGPERVQAKFYEMAITGLNSLADKYLAVATARHDGSVVRYAEPVFGRRNVRLAVHAAPIAPAARLAEHLFDAPRRSVICTSATLAANGGFEHFKMRCGIEESGAELVAPAVFDYPTQALLYQPPLPAYRWDNREAYYAGVAVEIARLLEVSRGRALCLFTSWDGLQQALTRLDAEVGGVWPLRAQGSAPREALLDWFRDTPHSVLLATRSFWEGVDIPGEDLSLVVLDKLPFPSPNDPLHQARMTAIDEAGGDSFGGYMLPLMTLTLKQGFGRLVRRATDRGVVAILDERLTSKGYGRKAVRDLPPARMTRDFADVHAFFRDALGCGADFALSVRASNDDAPLVRWRYRLVRLQDGRADAASGVADDLPGAVAGEIHAAVHGLGDLRARIERAGRNVADFHVELRCSPEMEDALAGRGPLARLPRVVAGPWKAAREGWGEVTLRGVPGAGE